MDRKQIGVYAGKVWQLLSNNEKWVSLIHI